MRRADHSVIVAVSASLVLHGMCLYVLSQNAVSPAGVAYAGRGEPAEGSFSPILTHSPAPKAVPPEPTPAPPEREPKRPDPPKPMPPSAAAPALPAIGPAPTAAPIKPVELAPEEGAPPVQAPDGFGELRGEDSATALKSLSGDQPMQAPKAESEQPFVSRDPVGHASVQSPPTPHDTGAIDKPGEAGPEGNGGTGADAPAVKKPQTPEPTPVVQSPQPAVPETPRQLAMAMSPQQEQETAPFAGPLQEAPKPVAKPEPQPPEEVQQKPQRSLEQPPPAVSLRDPAAGAAGRVGSPAAGTSATHGADPAPTSDSEMDPFSTAGAVEFRPGKVTARFGRKIKFVRPRLTLAGQYDLLALPVPTVVFRIRVDETGRVREVKIVKSSGSNEVDQPCKDAVYQWWFEPPKDKNGVPQPSELMWTITWRVR